MEKVIWSDTSPDYGHNANGHNAYGHNSYGHNAIDAGGLDAARGLLIGLAISQVFWLVLAYFVF